ncbi:hypothetical protein [Rhizobium metallidurans]|uniref:Uncharacterized protein n=1 Tax=Rhizobium metallidurans TaxID=1265931 RepID=A0A7W6GDH0_9HYPH|nr:hypothetical protein [Rhizobium metallidurans]MBB3967182.1 hypothetical protein [Rhizobium metallidurans]
MNDLIAKLSSYDIFINIIPGAVFVFFLSSAGLYTLQSDTIVGNLVLYYFAGLIISRIGSVIIEPLLRASGFVKYNRYSDFIIASEKDAKIQTLLEASNLYRTVIALILVCAIASSWDLIASWIPFEKRTWILVGCVGLAALFLLSYRKQNSFIFKRVGHHTRKAEDV